MKNFLKGIFKILIHPSQKPTPAKNSGKGGDAKGKTDLNVSPANWLIQLPKLQACACITSSRNTHRSAQATLDHERSRKSFTIPPDPY
jgi:hypothetical protein